MKGLLLFFIACFALGAAAPVASEDPLPESFVPREVVVAIEKLRDLTRALESVSSKYKVIK